MGKRKIIGIKEMLEHVTIAKVDLSPGGTSYRIWRASKRGDGHILVAEINRGHIFDHLGRYVAHDFASDRAETLIETNPV